MDYDNPPVNKSENIINKPKENEKKRPFQTGAHGTLNNVIDENKTKTLNSSENEIKDKERDTTFDEVLENVLHRDKLDSERAVAPLKQADDAVIIDNSNLSMEEQFEFMLKIALKRMEI